MASKKKDRVLRSRYISCIPDEVNWLERFYTIYGSQKDVNIEINDEINRDSQRLEDNLDILHDHQFRYILILIFEDEISIRLIPQYFYDRGNFSFYYRMNYNEALTVITDEIIFRKKKEISVWEQIKNMFGIK